MTSTFIQSFSLKVMVTINIEAEDYLAAAEHQKRIEDNIAPLLAAYPDASIVVSHGRGGRERNGRFTRVSSGRVRQYD